MKKLTILFAVLFCSVSWSASITNVKPIAGKKAYYLGDSNTISIGNISKVNEFQSHLKITFWDDEDSISFHEEGVKGRATTKDGTLTLDLTKRKLEWFKDEEYKGSVHWVETLKEKPANNKWSLKIADANQFKYCYQTPLVEIAARIPGSVIDYFVEDGIDCIRLTYPPGGAITADWRPLEIDGSIAVYHKSKSNNKYRTGKVLHIPQPKAVDAMGKWTWKEISIENGIYTETCPQKFLDEAVYPVRSNATFGFEGTGATSMGCDAGYNQCFWLGVSGEAGTATKIHIYCASAETNMGICAALYDNDPSGYSGGGEDSKEADNRLALSNALSLSPNASWMEFPVTSGGSFGAESLWTAQNNDDTFSAKYDTDASFDQSTTWDIIAYTGVPNNDCPDPWEVSVGQRDDRKTSTYITYTPSGAAPTSQVIFVNIN